MMLHKRMAPSPLLTIRDPRTRILDLHKNGKRT